MLEFFKTFGGVHAYQGISQNWAFCKDRTTIRQDALKRMTWQGLTESNKNRILPPWYLNTNYGFAQTISIARYKQDQAIYKPTNTQNKG